MKSPLFILPVFLFSLFSTNSAQAQNPAESTEQTLMEKWVLMSDGIGSNHCLESSNPLFWLLTHHPKHHESLYIHGAKIYDCLAGQAADPEQQAVYQDSTILMYDLRVRYFDQEAKVMNYKVPTAYKYYINNQDKYDQLWQWFDRALELNGANTFNSNLLAYMDLVSRYHRHKIPLTLEKILVPYAKISTIIDLKLAGGKEIEKTKEIRIKVDAILAKLLEEMQVNCSDIESVFGPRFDQQPNDLAGAQTLFKLLHASNCKDSPYYLHTAKTIFEGDPTYSMAVLIAGRSAIMKDLHQAEDFYQRALNLTESNTQMADIYLSLGDIKRQQNDFSQARAYYRQTIAADPSAKDRAYTKIGDLYYYSWELCKQGKSKVADRAVYFAAYMMYYRAGNQSKMELAQAQFPLASEIHMELKTAGQKIMVGCWINEEVIVRTRDGANN